MKSLRPIFQSSGHFIHDESGQDLMEYALLAAIIAVGVIASLRSVQTAIIGAYHSITTVMSSI